MPEQEEAASQEKRSGETLCLESDDIFISVLYCKEWDSTKHSVPWKSWAKPLIISNSVLLKCKKEYTLSENSIFFLTQVVVHVFFADFSDILENF